MLYAIRLGPIETGQGRVNAYVGIHEDGYVASPVITNREKDGLRALAAAASGERLLCEKRLARVGGAFGFTAAEPPPWVPMPRAALAAVLALGPDILLPDPLALHTLLHGAAEFWRGRPWLCWTDNDPIEVVLRGALEARFEGAVMGAGGIEFGLVLYRRPGAIARIANRVDAGFFDQGRREDSLAVTFDFRPRFAIAALRAAYGLPLLPVPIKVEQGALSRLDGCELAIVGGTLRLLGAVTPQHRDAALTIEAGDQRIEISVKMPPLAA